MRSKRCPTQSSVFPSRRATRRTPFCRFSKPRRPASWPPGRRSVAPAETIRSPRSCRAAGLRLGRIADDLLSEQSVRPLGRRWTRPGRLPSSAARRRRRDQRLVRHRPAVVAGHTHRALRSVDRRIGAYLDAARARASARCWGRSGCRSLSTERGACDRRLSRGVSLNAPRSCNVTTLFVRLADPDRTRTYALPPGCGAWRVGACE